MMTRNLNRRVEELFPVLESDTKARAIDILTRCGKIMSRQEFCTATSMNELTAARRSRLAVKNTLLRKLRQLTGLIKGNGTASSSQCLSTNDASCIQAAFER